MDIYERAKKLLEKAEPSVSGQSGHGKLLAAAGALVNGFDLSESDALSLLLSEFNPRCMPPWSEKDVRRKVSEAARLGSSKPRGYLIGTQGKGSQGGGQRRTEPRQAPTPAAARVKKRSEFDPSALQAMMCRGFKPDYQWLAEISPVDVRKCTPAQYLDAIMEPGEKNLVFYQYYSQGQYGFQAGEPGVMYRLGDRKSVRPVPVEGIEPSGREGAWYLANPVDGKWRPTGRTDEAGNPVLSRRLGENVTVYRYLLLESDEADEGFWLNLICQLPLPITALYTSGGRSVHALIRIDAESKSEFDAIRERLTPLLSKLGADPGAISGVRLTRLPGVLREGKRTDDGYVKFPKPRLQRLLYLNPDPRTDPLKTMTRLREVPAQ
jgi:hypothetical protein